VKYVLKTRVGEVTSYDSATPKTETCPRFMGDLASVFWWLCRACDIVHYERSRIILRFVSSEEVWKSSSELTQNKNGPEVVELQFSPLNLQ